MTNIKDLLNQISRQENQLLETNFLAPCVGGGKVRTKVCAMIYTFTPQPRNFAGWGIFQPESPQKARLIEEAGLIEINEYLQKFPAMRFFLTHNLRGQTWLGYPVNEGDMGQRTGTVKPVPIYLVQEGTTFETIIARSDGKNWWFAEIDRRADMEALDHLKTAYKDLVYYPELRFKGMTPEMKIAYELVTKQNTSFKANCDKMRLEEALKMGGGTLQEYQEREDYWVVEWTTGSGERHSSAIAKKDLTVVSAGICLSDLDSEFDLQSLVGVVEHRDEF